MKHALAHLFWLAAKGCCLIFVAGCILILLNLGPLRSGPYHTDFITLIVGTLVWIAFAIAAQMIGNELAGKQPIVKPGRQMTIRE
jgi:hypothetical protein